MSHDLIKQQLIASGKGTTVGGAMSIAAGWNAGCVLTYGGVGIVVITLDAVAGFVAAAEYQLFFVCGTATIQPTHVLTSPGVLTVTMATAVAGVATESTFWFKLERLLSQSA